MKADQIRQTYLSFFEERGHLIVPSASLVPSVHDPSVLLTTAGMQPFKPYFLGQSTPPFRRATSVQKCVRTPDIEEVGARPCALAGNRRPETPAARTELPAARSLRRHPTSSSGRWQASPTSGT